MVGIVHNQTLVKEMNANFEKYAPIALGYERETDLSKQVSKALKTFYFQDKPLDKTQVAALAQVGFNFFCCFISVIYGKKTLTTSGE